MRILMILVFILLIDADIGGPNFGDIGGADDTGDGDNGVIDDDVKYGNVEWWRCWW